MCLVEVASCPVATPAVLRQSSDSSSQIEDRHTKPFVTTGSQFEPSSQVPSSVAIWNPRTATSLSLKTSLCEIASQAEITRSDARVAGAPSKKSIIRIRFPLDIAQFI